MRILNLGSGVKTSASPNVTNIDWSIYLRVKRNPVLRKALPLVISGERLDRFHSLPDNILVHNLANGVPFGPDSIDVVYSSHMLEHLDRDVAPALLAEIHRVLKPGGIVRIVVPDLEAVCRAYVAHIAVAEQDLEEAHLHDHYIAGLLEQSVRREGFATQRQKPVRRFIENHVLGDARHRGETHQWMYDRISLVSLLTKAGYRSPRTQCHDTSQVPRWSSYGLDLGPDGREYRRHSLYVEAQK